MRLCFWMVAAAIASVSTRAAAEHRFTSGPSRVALLELYTSEGCSSCPPAEEWLSARRADEGLWKNYVPLSFHVTYWDYLGWQDRLADPAFTARQLAYAGAWKRGSVYTPCFVRDGAEWHPQENDRTKAVPAGELTIHELAAGEWEMSFLPSPEVAGDFDGYVALLGQGISSRVLAGENKGRTLDHNFVALELVRGSLSSRGSETARYGVFRVKAFTASPRSLAIAAWVTRRGQIDPVQATGGDLK